MSDTPLTFTAVEAGSTVQLTKTGSPTVSGLQYRRATSDSWSSYTIDTVITLTSVGDYVQFQNTESTLSLGSNAYVNFVMTGSVAASGNTQSLVDYSQSCPNSCYFSLFYNCTALITSPELPAENLDTQCYYQMFYGCTNMATAPNLPAPALPRYSYSKMFYNCRSLVNPPTIAATSLEQNVCYEMFRNCVSLTSAPVLSAATVYKECYYAMFAGCTSLVTPPALPAVTMETSCYSNMFNGCTSLSSAPELPATALATSCYDSMFYGCTALLASPQLPALTCAEACYLSMFRNCSSLTTVGTISATTMASQSCMYMFSNCTALTVPPDLLAPNLARWCYAYMFEGDTHLIKTPELVATTPEVRCYYHMFYGCSSLSSVKVSFTSWVEGSTEDWLSGVASSGVFYKPLALPEEYGTSRIPSGWQVINTDELECSPGLPTDIDPLGVTVEEQFPLTLTAVEDSTVTLNAVGSPTTSGLKFRTQSNAAWSTYTPGTTIQLPAGKSVQFWNSAETLSLSANVYAQFTMTGIVRADGDIQSMLNYIQTIPDYGLRRLFMNCSSLITPPKCPTKTVRSWGCSETFRGTSITGSPALPATVAEDSGYRGLFRDCKNMVSLSDLVVMEPASNCFYDMCVGCINLTAVKIAAVSLSASCLDSAFYGCSSLQTVEVAFSSWHTNATRIWLNGVSASGTFVKPSSLPEEYGPDRIPTGWTVINKD